NVTRVAFQSLAAVLGGTQSLHTNSRDEALSLPTEKSVKIALRTQQLAAYETSVTETVDPFSGSFYLEHLTDQLEKMAEDYIKKIDEQGGAVQSIENGYYQSEISKSAYEYQQAIETKKRIVVGVNEFQDDDEKNKKKLKILKVKPSLQNRQINNLRRFKKGRDSKKVNRGLEILKEAARTGPNLMPVILECVKAQATLGEICRVLREVFGEYRGQSTF
ncbi:MAG: methylmalonyl-CoA mutase family protein, partial [Planctomycetota bacterium]